MRRARDRSGPIFLRQAVVWLVIAIAGCTPEATLDGPLSVITLRSMRPSAFIGLMVDALKDRSGVTANEHVHVRNDVSEVVFHRLTSMPFQVDGDYIGEAESLHFRHHPDAVRLVVPVGFSQ
jgi:diacylglycerol kinase family enzyme